MRCKNCSKEFIITDADRAFYNKIDVPEPTRCPDCRMQRRLAFRNERVYYRDQCAKCHKDIISQFNPEEKLLVYCEECYWQDSWSGQDYGRDFNFNKTLGEQMPELNQAVPHMAMIHTNSFNCEYTHLAARNKDCYMLVESSDNENCIYSYWMQKSTDCVDASYTHESQLIYESDDLTNCYNLKYSRSCQQCSDSYFLLNCRDCNNCFGCVNLNHKNFYIFNEQKTKEEYENFITTAKLGTWSGVEAAQKNSWRFALKYPRKYAEIFNSEDCSGNYLHHAKRCHNVYHGYEVENASYGEHIWREAKDVMDVSTVGINAELIYDSINCALGANKIKFSNQCWGCHDLDYCFYCNGVRESFGCVGLKNGGYCILNKSYEPDDYRKLRDKIIEHLKQTGEWGEFLDPKHSLFGFNETVSNELYPLTCEAAIQKGFRWRETTPGTFGRETIKEIPDDINQIADNFIKEIMACATCKKNYKVVVQELAFYKKHQVPIPRLCPDCRHLGRIKNRGPQATWHRQCMNPCCQNEFETTYSPDRPERVYCESCYQQEIY